MREPSKKLSDRIGRREQRKLKGRGADRQVWFGLGMFGMVGWSVAIPTVLCIFLGVWIDLSYKGRYSWTLMLLAVGLVIGCANAWYWIQKEREAINREKENDEF